MKSTLSKELRCKIAIEKGFIYDPITGIVIMPLGKIASKKSKGGYIVFTIWIENKSYKLFSHQLAYYWVNKEISDILDIDHINGIRDDNRIINLRQISSHENQFNTKAKGYHWHKEMKKFQARLKIDNRFIHLGYFDNPNDAHNAYLEAKKIHHVIR